MAELFERDNGAGRNNFFPAVTGMGPTAGTPLRRAKQVELEEKNQAVIFRRQAVLAEMLFYDLNRVDVAIAPPKESEGGRATRSRSGSMPLERTITPQLHGVSRSNKQRRVEMSDERFVWTRTGEPHCAGEDHEPLRRRWSGNVSGIYSVKKKRTRKRAGAHGARYTQ